MEVEISNKITLKNVPEEMFRKLVNRLKVPNPKYKEAVNAGRSVYGIPKILYEFKALSHSSLIVPRGIRKNVLRMAAAHKEPVKISDRRNFIPLDMPIDSTAIKYRPYQGDAVRELTSNGEDGILVAPPGSGKTVIGLSLVPLLMQPTLWLTHTNRLSVQALERTATFLPSLGKEDVGIIGGGKWKVGNVLTVAMIQTLMRNQSKLIDMASTFGSVILDEAHHCPAPTFYKVIANLNPYYLYGLTATPYRRDGLEVLMFNAMGEVGYEITLKEVADQGSIMAPKVIYRTIRSPVVQDNNMARILKKLINDNKRNNIIVGDVLKEAHSGNFCIVVSDRKVHCETLCELISLGWDKVGIATGDYSKKYVEEQVQRYYNGEITVLCTTFALLGEGFDVPFMNRAFIATPFRAEAKVEQLIGRIQRTAENKKDAIVFDYVDADIGVLKNQFYSGSAKSCRHNVYMRLGLEVEPE